MFRVALTLFVVSLLLLGNPEKGETSTYETLHTFGETNNYPRYPRLNGVLQDDGSFIGVSTYGGTYDKGLLYLINSTGQVSALHTFGSATNDIENVYPQMIVQANNELYGQLGSGDLFKTSLTGTNYQRVALSGAFSKRYFYVRSIFYNASENQFYGYADVEIPQKFLLAPSIFKLDPETLKVKILLETRYETYSNPADGENNFLYLHNMEKGSLVRLSKSSGELETLFKFPYRKKFNYLSNAKGDVVVINDKLYGVCKNEDDDDSIYSINRNGTGFKLLQKVPNCSGIIKGPQGKLWGATSYDDSPNYLFSYDLFSNELDFFQSFNENQIISLGAANANHLMLKVSDSDSPDFGVLGKYNAQLDQIEYISPNGSPVAVLPSCAPVVLTNGTLIGVTEQGGAYDCGALVSIQSQTNQILFSIAQAPLRGGDGRPSSRWLVDGKDGWVYGASRWGGSLRGGFLFRINNTNQTVQTLAQFSSLNDTAYHEPSSAPVLATNGYIYGLLKQGRDSESNYKKDSGAIYRINRDGTELIRIKELQGKAHGCAFPAGGLIDGKDGYLYGFAGKNHFSRNAPEYVFRVRYDGKDFSVIYELGAASYDRRLALSIRDSNTLIVSFGDGWWEPWGQMIRISRNGKQSNVFYDNTGLSFSNLTPVYGDMAERDDGFLYGTYAYGILRISKYGSLIENILDFRNLHQSYGYMAPGLTLGPDGRLYGALTFGGAYKSGEYFAFTPPQAPLWNTNDISLLLENTTKALYLAPLTNSASATLSPQPLVNIGKVLPGAKVVATFPLLSTNANDLILQSGTKIFVFTSQRNYVVPEQKWTLAEGWNAVAGGTHPTLGQGLFMESLSSWGFMPLNSAPAITKLKNRTGPFKLTLAFGSRPNSQNAQQTDLLLKKGRTIYALNAPLYTTAEPILKLPQPGQRPLCFVPYGVSNSPVLLSLLERNLYLGTNSTPHAVIPTKYRPVGPR